MARPDHCPTIARFGFNSIDRKLRRIAASRSWVHIRLALMSATMTTSPFPAADRAWRRKMVLGVAPGGGGGL